MNIFSFDHDIDKNCQAHIDSYVVKLPLEAAQIVSTAYRLRYGDERASKLNLYKNTHVHHPLVKWAADYLNNLISIMIYGEELSKEYTYRYNKQHKSEQIFKKLWKTQEIIGHDWYVDGLWTLDYAPLCMPDYCKVGNRIESYKEYFKKEKYNKIRCKWTKRQVPIWLLTI